MGINYKLLKIPVVFAVLVLTVECRSNYGNEFFFGFPFNYYDGGLCNQLTVDIASENDGNATMVLPYETKTFIFKQNITSIPLNCSLALLGNFTKLNGVYLKTTVNVSLFATNYHRESSSTFLVLPHEVLGQSYVTASYLPIQNGNDQSYILIIGTENLTNVIISDSPGSVFINQTINKLEITQFASLGDLTAVKVESNKPVAVITGTSCSNVPVEVRACDSLMQEMIPNDASDNIFIVPPIPKTPAYELRVLKSSNGSHSRVCFYNKTQTVCVNDSASLSCLIDNDSTVVIADQPHNVIQYGVGQIYKIDRGFGDPFMTVIPGIHNYLNKYVFLIPNTYKNCSNFIVITILSVYINGLVLDGNRPIISEQNNVAQPFGNYSVLTVNISTGYHVIYHNTTTITFGVLVYGLGSSDFIGYGYPAGILMENRATSLSSTYELNTSNSLETISSTVGNYPTTSNQNISEYNYPTNRSGNSSTPILYVNTLVGIFPTPTLINSSSVANETKELYFGNSETRVSAGTIVGIIVGVIALAIIFVLIAFLVKRKRKIKPKLTEDKGDGEESTSAHGVTEDCGH